MAKEITKLENFAFLFLLDSLTEMMGPDMGKGVLQRVGEVIAERLTNNFPESSLQFQSLEEFHKSENPLTFFESMEEYGDNIILGNNDIILLNTCPFSKFLKDFLEINKVMPPLLGEITEIFNAEGLGHAVSPFCVIHQTFRKEVSKSMKLHGKDVDLLQLGCRASSGKIAYAHDNIKAVSSSESEIESLLSDRACSYKIILKEE